MEESIKNVTQKIGTLSIPVKPLSFGKGYEFPEIFKTSEELGNWLTKLSSWKSYAIRLLAKADIERIIIDESYDSQVSQYLASLFKEGKKVTKDIALGIMISEVEGFKALGVKFAEKKAEVEALKKIIDIYSTQLDAVSREISRRGQDIQSIGKTL